VFFEAPSDGVAKHIIAEHVIKVIEATSFVHPIGKVSARLVVPIVQPAAIELVRDLLLFFRKARVMVLEEEMLAGLKSERIRRFILPLLVACAKKSRICWHRYKRPGGGSAFVLH
jgi:hypothetical protein